jgi:hypothetical protein
MAKSGQFVRTLIDLDRIASADVVTSAISQTTLPQALTSQDSP